jgi:hypothetical protein
MGGAYFHSPNTPSWRDSQLQGTQGQLYLYLYIVHVGCIYDVTKTAGPHDVLLFSLRIPNYIPFVT